MYINLWYNSQGHPNIFILQISQNIDGFRQTIHKAFTIPKTKKQNPLKNSFILTICQNHTLALKEKSGASAKKHQRN